MRAFITGGAGFAGSYLAEHLLRAGQEVVVLARAGEGLSHIGHLGGKVRVERGDIQDSSRLTALLREIKPQRIYHLAGLSSPAECARNPRLAYDVNFTGTFNLLSAWRELQFDSRLLHVSSSQVYGAVEERDLPVREDAPLRPANPYAGSKAAAELVALQFFESEGLPIVRVRPFNHTGPRQAPTFVCSSLARQIAEINLGLRPPVVTVGNLEARRDFSDVRDIVRGYHLLLEKGQAGDVYQLCSGRATVIGDILRSLIALASQSVQVTAAERRPGSRDAVAAWGDASKARQAVGWSPQYDLDATLRDLKLYWESELRPEPSEMRVAGPRAW